jgi:hypothetical protein
MYAYLYIELAKMQIDIVGESQLVGYPTQYPSVSMMDWTNAKPNARFWVLKLLKDNFGPGDKLVETGTSQLPYIVAQGFVTAKGNKLLLINKHDQTIEVQLPEGAKQAQAVDVESGEGPARAIPIQDNKIQLNPFAVTVVAW